MERATNCAGSGQTAGGTPLLESLDVGVGEQQCAMRNAGLARLVEHEAQETVTVRLSHCMSVNCQSGGDDPTVAQVILERT